MQATINDVRRGTTKAKHRSGRPLFRLSGAEREQLEEAKSRGYLVTRGFQQEVARAWRDHCEQKRQLYIRVRRSRRGKGMTLYLDSTPAGYQFSKPTQDALYLLARHLTKDLVVVGKDYLFACGLPF